MILSGELKPNFGRFNEPPDWNEILKHFKGNELYNYFKKYLDSELTVTYKVQHVDAIIKNAKGTIRELFLRKDKKGDRTAEYAESLGLTQLMDRTIDTLSGGELQRLQLLSLVFNKLKFTCSMNLLHILM